jgi:LmbE family N-acetylglucosaminyl deacetylase
MGILVVAAHPDDEVLGCGGTIAGLSAREDIWIGILGEAPSSRYAARELAPAIANEESRAQAQAAGRILGASEVVFASLPDNRFDSVPLVDMAKTIEGWVERFRPDTVYTHAPGDLNMDHTLTFRSVLIATRPMPGSQVRQVFAFEVPSSTEWAFQSLSPAFRPNTFVDITDTIDAKLRALEAYKTEVRPFPHPRSPEALQAIAQRWGSTVGVQYAEAFQLIRSIQRAV